jgi:energy-coupling factor transporter ATP-binding protein EcfA2
VLLNGTWRARRGCVPPERRGVGIVFQDYALFPHLNVLDNVMFGLHALGGRRAASARWRRWRWSGSSDYARRFPHELSGGQQQRVALARALAPQPSLLLLDEPFSNLDVVLKEQVREEVGQILRAAGTTALFVVHDLEDVLSIADRIAILKHGGSSRSTRPRPSTTGPPTSTWPAVRHDEPAAGRRRAGDGFDTPSATSARRRAPACGRGHAVHPAAGCRDRACRRRRHHGHGPADALPGDHQEIVLSLAGDDGGAHELLVHTRADAPRTGRRHGGGPPVPAVRVLG